MAQTLHKPFIYFFLLNVLFSAFEAQAVELSGYGGMLSHSAVSGCCQSTGAAMGYGALGRLRFGTLGELELAAYSNGKWNDGHLLKPFYLIGRPRTVDPQTGSGLVSVQSLANWRWISSAGVGYFTHNARTTDFDLPILITGLMASNFNHFLYSWNDEWSVGGIAQISLAGSSSDISLVFGTYLTLSYYFH